MTQAVSDLSLARLKRHLGEYRPQLEKALLAIQVLETSHSESDEFALALADLQVCATVLEPYSEGLVNAIEQFTEDQPDD
ncbi:hypothetical protein IQ273_05475 [Nodosilinea sp. LEGE 07298]|uniref:hypothetical protein n=1 Tax=Nodosilinea sp. LEGE 07298 TaxID=2777970 RepID=UPI00187F2FF8|nr:hypothetical protein [Nodosilinea sp. LEGE 07298]MBE9108867.1 hypothetical protein [Nodosilinea sp. LEGE 07298]